MRFRLSLCFIKSSLTVLSSLHRHHNHIVYRFAPEFIKKTRLPSNYWLIADTQWKESGCPSGYIMTTARSRLFLIPRGLCTCCCMRGWIIKRSIELLASYAMVDEGENKKKKKEDLPAEEAERTASAWRRPAWAWESAAAGRPGPSARPGSYGPPRNAPGTSSRHPRTSLETARLQRLIFQN